MLPSLELSYIMIISWSSTVGVGSHPTYDTMTCIIHVDNRTVGWYATAFHYFLTSVVTPLSYHVTPSRDSNIPCIPYRSASSSHTMLIWCTRLKIP